VELAQKFDRLLADLGSLDSVLVAYSGGTDSAFLAWAAHQALGPRMLAVLADSPSLPRREMTAAVAFAAQHSIPLEVLQTAELDRPEYRRNDAQRCFHCKDELFTRMEARRAELGFRHLAYGRNLDDSTEFRPGQHAALQHGALAPLAAAQLSKSEIRQLARQHGLAIADKPASACLSSRIAYGDPVTPEALRQVELAEDALHCMGFAQVRVRHHGQLARVEIAREDLPRALHLHHARRAGVPHRIDE
jgi:pyridinium-3,5-biscarboxylic acid mononucleotide sulfurtransferase